MREGAFSQARAAPYQGHERRKARNEHKQATDLKLKSNHWREAMKTILSALLALSVLAGIAAPASAFDAESFYQQLDRQAE